MFGKRRKPAEVPPPVALGEGDMPSFEPRHDYDWRRLQNPPAQTYADSPDPGILQLLPMTPTFALDIGCNTGMRALAIKEAFPDCKVWGVEPNAAAASIARGRIDRVLEEPIDHVRWADMGVARGAIDTVLLFDVLEHIYDPWATLLMLRNLVSERAQIIVSIPNVRNVMLIEDLVKGSWRYRPQGLLDITHIRFFTRDDLLRMFYQTGYRLLGKTSTLDDPSRQIVENHRSGVFPQTVNLDGVSIVAQSLDDLVDLCAVQNISILQPATYESLTPEERKWVDSPHPKTRAYAGGNS